ncbi:histidine phosphatase family protein [Mangrovibrevibacter kandeliae]|uniref:histidine phosphatase family protein n=1 Tax=Mangrovibrevibacter kandeliae TaxID=2968473 RepID=UPI0021196C6D|nr:histidine phosphatase family protein [Aurantimonas sp. CSK15Z-1]MCQ8780717.1 histidine phosphatase family protein [Aurantimonas sp. CSK15Z-1]
MALPLLYFVRHGETDWNAQGRFQGQRDIPLNATGRAQARRNGAFLRQTLGDALGRFDFVASPLSRAAETMRLVRAELGLPETGYRSDERLVELHYGGWEGRTFVELRGLDAALMDRREADKWRFVPPGTGAESYEILALRIQPVLDALKGPTVMVAHGGIARVLLLAYGGMTPQHAAHVGIPQDRVLRIENERAIWL